MLRCPGTTRRSGARTVERQRWKAASMAWWSIGFAVDYNRVAELATASMLVYMVCVYMVCVVTAWSPCPRSSQSGNG